MRFRTKSIDLILQISVLLKDVFPLNLIDVSAKIVFDKFKKCFKYSQTDVFN